MKKEQLSIIEQVGIMTVIENELSNVNSFQFLFKNKKNIKKINENIKDYEEILEDLKTPEINDAFEKMDEYEKRCESFINTPYFTLIGEYNRLINKMKHEKMEIEIFEIKFSDIPKSMIDELSIPTLNTLQILMLEDEYEKLMID
mgnify:CR=1 FL=1